jgi:hypothetical protein
MHLVDNVGKDDFMIQHFSNTSTLWAFSAVQVGASKADIWRYCVLWLFGGAYMDDDSSLKAPFDKMVKPSDRLVLSYEKNKFGGCFVAGFRTSNECLVKRFNASFPMPPTADPYASHEGSHLWDRFFEGRTILTWAILAAPRHKLFQRAIETAVQVVRAEWLGHPLVREGPEIMKVFCGTGPLMLTAVGREMLLMSPDQPDMQPDMSLYPVDFRAFGGVFKEHGPQDKSISKQQRQDSYYQHNMVHHGLKLLASASASFYLDRLQMRAVTADGGRSIYLIEHGIKQAFLDPEAFRNSGLKMAQVVHLLPSQLDAIPEVSTRITEENGLLLGALLNHTQLLIRPHERCEV